MALLCSQTLTHLKLEFAASSAGDGPDAPPGLCSKIGDLYQSPLWVAVIAAFGFHWNALT